MPPALEACCLTEEEMALGPDGWTDFADPFPAWVIHGDDRDPDIESVGS